MYVCEKHGELSSIWCDKCVVEVKCDCSDIEQTKGKTIFYDFKGGTRWLTVYVSFCNTCGKPQDIWR